MNKIKEYLTGSTSLYGSDLTQNQGELDSNPTYVSLKWQGTNPLRLRIKREDEGEDLFPLFEVSGVADTIDIVAETVTYQNNSTILPVGIVDVGDPNLILTREFTACLRPNVPFPDLTGDVSSGPTCTGGENEVAFSLTDRNTVPQAIYTITLGDQEFTGTMDLLYQYLNTISSLEVVLLSRAVPQP